MTDNTPDFIKSLLSMLRASGAKVEEFKMNPDGSIERVSTENPSRTIHKYVDMDLIRALQQWFESQDTTQLQVMSTLAYALANEIYLETKSEDEGCIISTDYERYIHQSVHILRQTYGEPKSDEKGSDVEK